MTNPSKRKIIIVSLIALITILGGLTFLGHKQEQQKQIAKEHALYKHGFRLLEEQLAIYIKEHYEGVSKIEFSPIYEDGGDGYSMHTLNIVLVIYDQYGDRAILGGKIGKVNYKSYGLYGELTLDFSQSTGSEIIELKKIDAGEVIDVSDKQHLPKEAELDTNSAVDDNLEALVEDGQLKEVKKSDKGSPNAKVIYNLEIKKGDYTKWR